MSNQLQTIEKLVENGKPIFGVFDRVNTVNYLDYHSYLISNKAVGEWRKKLRANQFCFIQVFQPPYRVCVAVATLNWVTSSFCYIYNSDTDDIELVEALQPFTRKTKFNLSTYENTIEFTSKNLSVAMNFSESNIELTIASKILQLSSQMQKMAAPLSVCTPTGKRGWTYTQKEPLIVNEGQLVIKNTNNNILDKKVSLNNATATLDWSLGYMRRVTNWYWTCISGFLADGRHFAINLATGVNESGASENACWIDRKRYHLPAVMFDRQSKRGQQVGKGVNQDSKKPWRVTNQALNWSNVKIDLAFTPVNCYQKSDRLMVVDSIFEQWVGIYNGTIELDGEIVEIEDMMGLAEDHYAKW